MVENYGLDSDCNEVHHGTYTNQHSSFAETMTTSCI